MPTFKDTSSDSNKKNILFNGGTMGELIRSFNWKATSLGCIEEWPVSLITTTNMMLQNHFPMLIWWGNDLVQLYNDSFHLNILGNNGMHPQLLGEKATKSWKDKWTFMEPIIKQVLNGGASVWNEDQLIPRIQNGQETEAYWTYCYSSLRAEDGQIKGVLMVCMETTKKIIAFKQLQQNEDQLRFAIEATELGTFDYNPSAKTIKSNNRLKDWFGLPADTEVKLSLLLRAVTEQDKKRVWDGIQTALKYEYGGFFNMEYSIIHPVTKQERIVKTKGKTWFNENKIAYRFNGTIQDITEQADAIKKMQDTERKLRSTTDRLTLALDTAELSSYESDLITGEILFKNQRKLNYGAPANVVMNTQELYDIIHPEDREMFVNKRNEAIEKRLPYRVEYRIKDLTGEIKWLKVYGKVVYDELDRPIKMIGIIQDVTEQHLYTEELKKQVTAQQTELNEYRKDNGLHEAAAQHDLKKEIHLIKKYITELKKETASTVSQQIKNAIEQLENTNDKITSIINNTSNNQTTEGSQTIDLNEIIQYIEADIEALIEHKNESIDSDGFSDKNKLSVQVYQVLLNTETETDTDQKKKLKAIISVSSSIIRRKHLEFIKITIKDSSIGIHKQNALPSASAAKPQSNKKPNENGIGLAICKKIVARHGGSIVTDSIKKNEAVFSIIVPMQE